jgi:uncharacterized protein YjgD (DUF1641 family)
MEQEHTESTQDKKHCMEETVERVKERIIATSKLLGYLQNAKKGELACLEIIETRY